MTADKSTYPVTSQQVDSKATELFADPGKVWRSRFLGAFLMLNWGIMGWFTIRAPSLWSAALTLSLGLIAFIGAVSQIRAARRAGETPLVRWDEDNFGFRSYTRLEFKEIPWSRMRLNPTDKPSTGARPPADSVEVTIAEARIFFFGWPEEHLGDGKRPGVDDVAPRSILGLPKFSKEGQQRIVSKLRRALSS